jgi:site-specific recombinase XerD
MTKYTANCQAAARNTIGNSIRCYLRYKATCGESTASLSAALPHTAHWRQSSLPKTLSASQITQLLGAIDRGTSVGKRDYAIVRCFVDLGLRNIEVSRLKLEDIDWRNGTISIHGKARRVDVLPLPVKTGQALTTYLREVRPQTTVRELFVRSCASYDRPLTPLATRNAVLYAAERCGLGQQIGGTHIFRHTLAQRLVRGGASLKEIADLLCHRSLDTAAIYAKIDEAALTAVALPWAGRLA